MRGLKRSLLLVAAAPFVVCGYGFVTCFLDESYDTTRYTAGYFLCVSANVRAIPVVDAVPDTLKYHSSCGDGPKPPSSSVMFRTTSARAALAAIDAHLTAQQLVPEGTPIDGAGTVTYGDLVDVYSDDAGNISVYWVE